MSKYKIYDEPTFKPSKCCNCGSAKNDGRKYIDLGLEVDWYGTVYFCGRCLFDIATAMGLFKAYDDALAEAKAEHITRERLLEEGELLRDKMLKTLKEFEDYYTNLQLLSPEPDTSSSDSVGASETESDKLGNEASLHRDEQNTPESKLATPKSTPVSRRKDVPSLAELLSVNK